MDIQNPRKRAQLYVFRAVLLGLLGTVASGCVTLNKFSVMEERVEALEKEQALLVERVDRQEQRLENLYSRMKESSDELRKSGADQGATLEDLRLLIVESNGKIEEMAFRLENQRQQVQAVVDVLDERLGVTIGAQEGALPEDKEALFQVGSDRLTHGMTRKARAALRAYIQKFPKDERVAEALFLIAESYVADKKYELAIREYQTIHDQYSKSELVPKALWRIADCLVAQGQCKKAQAVLKYLRDTHRKSPEAEKVPARTKELDGLCK